MKHIQRLLCCCPQKDEDASGDPKRALENNNGVKVKNSSAELGVAISSSSLSPQVAADLPMSYTNDNLATSSNTGVDVSRVDPCTPAALISPSSVNTSANATASTNAVSTSSIPEAELTIIGKKRNEKGSQGGKIAVAVVEKALHAAKLVLDNFSIPGAGTAVEGILKVITIVKVSVLKLCIIADRFDSIPGQKL